VPSIPGDIGNDVLTMVIINAVRKCNNAALEVGSKRYI